MRNLKNYHYLFLLAITSMTLLTACKKQLDWLDKKSIKSDVSPQTLADYQAILDNSILNNTSNVALFGADNITFTDVSFNTLNLELRNLYTWNKDIWIAETSANWGGGFKNIEYANIVLDGLSKIKHSDVEYNSIKGTALFDRALAYYNLAQLFCKAYSSSAGTDMGLPLKASADVNEVGPRATLSETYQQIVGDLKNASTLLPENQSYLTRPGTAAAYALLSKVYLQMEDYTSAENYATKSLAINSQLLDFNNSTLVNLTTTYRFPTYAKNIPEILFYIESTQFADLSPQASSKAIIAPELYNSYDANDLRKSLFYVLSGSDAKYRGTYSGNIFNFSGLAVNEILLIRAECLARSGNAATAMTDLNTLLKTRYKTGTYISKTALSADEALVIILNERRKELPFTANVRWEDLKRLNKEARFQKTLTRTIGGIAYSLAPNDKRYVLPIPTQEILLTGIAQNER